MTTKLVIEGAGSFAQHTVDPDPPRPGMRPFEASAAPGERRYGREDHERDWEALWVLAAASTARSAEHQGHQE